MPVHHRLRFLTFPMRASRLCSLWPDMRPLRFRRGPFGRDGAFDPGGATASRIARPHMLPSTVPSVSASAKFLLSWLNPPPHPITVYASHPPLPTTAQHSLPGGALPPYRGRSFTGRNASASPDAPERQVDEAIRYALSRPVRLHREFGFENAGGVSKSGCVKGDIFDVCCLSHIGREAKSEPTFGPSILSKSSHSWRRSASGSAPGLHKRGDNQVYRARVLEVRIHLPPAKSPRRTAPAVGAGTPLRKGGTDGSNPVPSSGESGELPCP